MRGATQSGCGEGARVLGLSKEATTLTGAQVLWGIGFGLLGTLFPLYLRDLGATPTDIGLVFGVGNVIAAASFIPIGLAADRFGRRPLLIGVWLTSTIGAAAFLPLTDWRGAFIGSSLYWIGSAALPLMSAHLAALTPRSRLSSELGMVYGAFFFGTILAAPLAGSIGALVGLRGGIAIATVAFMLSSALTFRLSRTRPVAHVPGRPPLPRSFWTLIAITPLAALITTIVNPLFPVYVRDVAAVPLERVGVYVGLVALGAALFSAVNGRIADRFGPVPAVIGAGAVLTLGAGTIALSGRSEVLLALGSFLLGAQTAPNPVLAGALERVLPPARAALGYSGFQLVFALGFGTGGLLSGVLYDTDPLLPMLVQVALALPLTATVAVIVARILSSPRAT
ncbi:MAG TPA: MFS transporter [Candidatus Limnocylindria bacterium]|nr:MFS transporter [Candidatus Limnocylindria bacterium]